MALLEPGLPSAYGLGSRLLFVLVTQLKSAHTMYCTSAYVRCEQHGPAQERPRWAAGTSAPSTYRPAKQNLQLLTGFGGVCTADGTSIAACSAKRQNPTNDFTMNERTAAPRITPAWGKTTLVLSYTLPRCLHTAEGTWFAACRRKKGNPTLEGLREQNA